MGSPLRAVAAVICAALASGLAVFFLVRKPAPVLSDESRLEQLQRDNQSLRDRVAQLERDIQSPHPARGGTTAAADPARRSAPAPTDETRLEAIRSLAQTQARLQSANAALVELQEKTVELEAAVSRLSEENRKLQAAGEENRESLASLRRVVDATETELKAKTDRIAQLDATIRRLRDDNAAGSQRAQQSLAAARDLEDINRRRENTLSQLQRRYRDLTDQLRALAVRLDSQRDSPSPLTPELSRIQSAVQSAEEDLRQIVSLNSQAARAAQRLGPQK